MTAQGSTWEGRHIYTTARMPTGVDPTAGEVPDRFTLDQNYPNPFNATTQISFGLPEASSVTLEVFDINGRIVKSIHNGLLPAGTHILEWDGTNQQGSTAASGVYLYRLETGNTVATKKMILLK